MGAAGRRWLGTVVLGCLVVLGLGLLRFDEAFSTPNRILVWFALPVSGLALAAAFALLPGAGRLALAAALASWGTAELGFGLARVLGGPSTESFVSPDYFQPDPTLGYGPQRGFHTRAWKRIDGRGLYDVEYDIDAAGRRIAPIEERERRRRFLLVFGDSFAFGEGVPGEATLAAHVARRAPDWLPYTYAFHGYGPNQMLAKLESGALRDEVREADGLLVYAFIGAHASRAIGSMVVYSRWAEGAPYYALDAAGTPRRRGSFTTGRPWTSLGYSLLGASQVLRFLDLDIPVAVTDRHIELTARLVERSAELFRAQFGSQRFVAVAYPEHWPSETSRRLADALARAGIEVLDYADLFGQDRADYFFPEDRHPNGRAHRAVAERLVADLDLADAPALPARAVEPRTGLASLAR